MYANARNKLQHVGSLNENTKDSGPQNTHNSIHTTLWCACAGATLLDVLYKRTQLTLLDHAPMTAKQQKCWHLLAMKFDRFQTSSTEQLPASRNNTQQRTTWCVTERPQHVGSKNVASCWPTILRAFARAFSTHSKWFLFWMKVLI